MFLENARELVSSPQRIISLVPSQTELLWYLGLEKETIGITKFCVHPKEWLTSKTIIGGTKNLRVEKIKELNPDLVIANKEENVKDQVEAIAAAFPVWLTDVNNLEDAKTMISDIGTLTRTAGKAMQLVEDISHGFSQVDKLLPPIKTAYLVWRDPLMTIGGDTFIHDMMEKCGLHNIFAGTARYPAITVSDLVYLECQLLLLSSEPYPFKEKHQEELQALLPHTKIMLVDGEMFSWYGSRLLQSTVYLNELVTSIKMFN